MQPASPAALQLAQRLRQLRQQWANARLTQDKLAAALSAEERLASATISSWESLTAPKLPPIRRLHAYARFFATLRSVEEPRPRLLPLDELTQDERATYTELERELLALRNSVVGDSGEEAVAFSRSWHFGDTGNVTLVCAELPSDATGPLAEPAHPNYTELQRYADVDALIELFGHIRAENPQASVRFKIPHELVPDDLTGHVVIIGGVGWNKLTGQMSEMATLPVTQFEHPALRSGDIFKADVDGQETEFWPRWADTEPEVLAQDVGMLARVPNPLNSSRTLTMCNGIHSRGVYGAVRSLTDAQLRDANERYIAANFRTSDSFVILMSVQVIGNRGMTPDLNGDGVVLYQWSPDRSA